MTEIITPTAADAATAALLHARAAKIAAQEAVAASVGAADVAENAVHNLFYGQMSTDPVTRPDGTPIQDGDRYYNTLSRGEKMRVDGAWSIIAMSVAANALVAGANLGDVSSVAQARTNLGLGTAAQLNAGIANGVAQLDNTGKVPAAQLNLGTGGGLVAANNLSELTNTATARSNLGLGTAATKAAGSANGVADLDGSSKVPTWQLPAGTANGVASLDATGFVPKAQMRAGVANGMAELDSSGVVPVWQLPAFSSPTTVAKSADYTTVSGDSGKVISVTTGASDKTITLVGANTAGDGAIMIVQKVDSGAGKTIVEDSDGTTNIGWLSNQFDMVSFRSNGAAWTRYWHRITPRVETFTASGTYTKPPLAVWIHVVLRGPGGGGGSGRSGGATMHGGGGGGGGAFAEKLFRAAEVASTETVTVPAGGGGAGGVGSANTNGSPGTDASPTLFGSTTKLNAGGGKGGPGGSTGVINGGNGGGVWEVVSTVGDAMGFEGASIGGLIDAQAGNNAVYGGASAGSSSSSVAAGAGGSSGYGGGGGGCGGGYGSVTARAPGAGGRSSAYTPGGGGAAGTSGISPTAGTAGASAGVGGGGGGSHPSGGNAAAGGAGGVSAGGGGGGAASNGTSGGGGNGGRGEAVVTTIF